MLFVVSAGFPLSADATYHSLALCTAPTSEKTKHVFTCCCLITAKINEALVRKQGDLRKLSKMIVKFALV